MRILNRIRSYLADVVAEMKKVSWVKRRELFTTTFVVIVFSVILSAFIGVVDLVFSQLLQLVLR